MSRMLFDYRCTGCTWEGEVYAATPAPRSRECPACGAEARRRYTTAGLARSGSSLAAIAPAGGSVDCRQNADVPGLCHVAPEARRALIAHHRGDVETYQAEKKRQTREFEQNGPPPAAQVFAHGH